MKPHVLSLLTEKLRQREMKAQLQRSKRITAATREAPRPILDALTKLAKETGKPGEDILNEYVSGKASFPALDAALASHRKPTVTAAARPAPANPPAPAVDLLNASPAEVGRIIAQSANINRGKELREQVRNQFASMPPGPERTAFFEKFRAILRQ